MFFKIGTRNNSKITEWIIPTSPQVCNPLKGYFNPEFQKIYFFFVIKETKKLGERNHTSIKQVWAIERNFTRKTIFIRFFIPQR